MRLFTAPRASAVVASAAALTLGLAGAASAHECYKVNWSEAAYAKLSQGNTAWVALSDMYEMFVVPEGAGCEGWGDPAAELYMEATGLSQEPLVHSRALIGKGYNKAHPKGFQPMPIDYLDWGVLDAVVYEIGVECGAFPPPGEG